MYVVAHAFSSCVAPTQIVTEIRVNRAIQYRFVDWNTLLSGGRMYTFYPCVDTTERGVRVHRYVPLGLHCDQVWLLTWMRPRMLGTSAQDDANS